MTHGYLSSSLYIRRGKSAQKGCHFAMQTTSDLDSFVLSLLTDLTRYFFDLVMARKKGVPDPLFSSMPP